METINLRDKLATFDETWAPKIIGALNGQHVKLAKLEGEFVWHAHEHEDELFLVIDGELTLEFRDREVHLAAGELCIVPRGVEHRPVTSTGASILLFEPEGTAQTGGVESDLLADEQHWI